MLGISDGGILTAYLLCILSTLLCVVYGVMNWNKGGNDEEKEISEEINWEKQEE